MLVVDDFCQHVRERPVEAFYFALGLWGIGCAEGLPNVQQFTDLGDEFRRVLRILVRLSWPGQPC